MSNFVTLLLLIAGWSLSGIISAPFVFRIMSAIHKEELDRNALILFAIYGPIPAIYFLTGYVLMLFNLVIMAVFWVLYKAVNTVIKLVQK